VAGVAKGMQVVVGAVPGGLGGLHVSCTVGFIIRMRDFSRLDGCCLQERERRGDTYAPKWFKAAPDAEVFSNEFSAAECPLWEFTGEALKLPKREAKPEGGPGPRASGPGRWLLAVCILACDSTIMQWAPDVGLGVLGIADNCGGSDFCPWVYPEIHRK
jgi:hypothetical protein